MCPPNPESPSHLPLHPIPLGCPRALVFGCPASRMELTQVIYFTYGNVYVSIILSNHPILSSSQRAQKSILYVCVSFAVLHVGLSVPSFYTDQSYHSNFQEDKLHCQRGNAMLCEGEKGGEGKMGWWDMGGVLRKLGFGESFLIKPAVTPLGLWAGERWHNGLSQCSSAW